MTLFDTGDYWRHPGLWPGADETVMTDDQVVELLWPGITSGNDWQESTVAEGLTGWDREAML